MSNDIIQVGDTVEANRDLPKKDVAKGDKGKVYGLNILDSEIYLYITMENGNRVELSCENCWNKVT